MLILRFIINKNQWLLLKCIKYPNKHVFPPFFMVHPEYGVIEYLKGGFKCFCISVGQNLMFTSLQISDEPFFNVFL